MKVLEGLQLLFFLGICSKKYGGKKISKYLGLEFGGIYNSYKGDRWFLVVFGKLILLWV